MKPNHPAPDNRASDNNLWLIIFFLVGVVVASIGFAFYQNRQRDKPVQRGDQAGVEKLARRSPLGLSVFHTADPQPADSLKPSADPSTPEQLNHQPDERSQPKSSQAAVEIEPPVDDLSRFQKWTDDGKNALQEGDLRYEIRAVEARLDNLREKEREALNDTVWGPLKIAERLAVLQRNRDRWQRLLTLIQTFLDESQKN